MTTDQHRPYLREAAEMRAAGQDHEAILRTLRAKGASIMECILTVRQLEGISLSQAKDLVHHSAAWADLREHHEAIHDEVISIIEREFPPK